MKLLDTAHKKKAALLTTIIALLLLLVFFVLGLSYLDPPITYGMEVNFGMYSTGKSVNQSQNPPVSKPDQIQEVKIENSNPPPPKKTTTPISEKVSIEKQSEISITEEEKQQEARQRVEKEIPLEAKQPPKPKISEATKNLVSNLIQKELSEGEKLPNESIEGILGDQAQTKGDLYSNSYYSEEDQRAKGTRFGLNGRSLRLDGKMEQDCNQEGIVVVRITVDQNGDVVKAIPGVKGSTNTHPCLLEPAKITAKLHKWHADNKAPNKQIGFVVINFKLGE